MSENNGQNTPQDPPQAPAPDPVAAGQPAPPPAPSAQPVMPAPASPQQPASPAQPVRPEPGNGSQQGQPQNGGSQPQDAGRQGQQNQQIPQQQPQNERPEPTLRENGAFSFFATPSDPDDDPAPMSWGFKIGWFVLGFIGGMLGLLMAWISTSTLSPKRRRQAVIATWAGFAAQAIVFLIIVLTGGTFPFMPTGGSTAAQSGGSAGTGSGSAFG